MSSSHSSPCIHHATDKTVVYDYTVDDSTSTIDCVCPLAPPTPRLCLALQRALDTGSVATPPVVSPPSYYEPFRVGTLVRVVGEVVDGMYLGAPKRIVVAKIGAYLFILIAEVGVDERVADLWRSGSYIEFVDDPNVEFLHHFIVAQTHAEVYSKPFDVATRLNRMIAAERDEQMEWKGSQMTESVAGSPTKVRFPLFFISSATYETDMIPRWIRRNNDLPLFQHRKI